MGNGDGSFGAFSQLQLINFLTTPSLTRRFKLIDFNADGKLDAVLGSGELALGNGDGTFSLGTPLFPQPASPQTPLNYPLLQANLFPDSWPSFVYLNLASGANAVFTPQDSSGATVNAALSVGTHTLTAQYSGDSIYAAGVSPALTITVAPAVTTMAVTSSANPSYAGQSVTFTATIAGLIPGAGGTVTFSNGSTPLGTAPVSNGTASFTTTTLSSAGSQTITAAYGGDANDGASSGSVTQTVVAPVTIGPGTGDSTSLTVSSGQSVTTQVSFAGAAGFSGSVKFSCTGLPMNASCSFSPASVTVSGTTAASTSLTVSTAATAMASARDGESLARFDGSRLRAAAAGTADATAGGSRPTVAALSRLRPVRLGHQPDWLRWRLIKREQDSAGQLHLQRGCDFGRCHFNGELQTNCAIEDFYGKADTCSSHFTPWHESVCCAVAVMKVPEAQYHHDVYDQYLWNYF